MIPEWFSFIDAAFVAAALLFAFVRQDRELVISIRKDEASRWAYFCFSPIRRSSTSLEGSFAI